MALFEDVIFNATSLRLMSQFFSSEENKGKIGLFLLHANPEERGKLIETAAVALRELRGSIKQHTTADFPYNVYEEILPEPHDQNRMMVTIPKDPSFLACASFYLKHTTSLNQQLFADVNYLKTVATHAFLSMSFGENFAPTLESQGVLIQFAEHLNGPGTALSQFLVSGDTALKRGASRDRLEQMYYHSQAYAPAAAEMVKDIRRNVEKGSSFVGSLQGRTIEDYVGRG